MPGQLSAFYVFHTIFEHKSVLLNMLHTRNLHGHNKHTYSALPNLKYNTCTKTAFSNLVGSGDFVQIIENNNHNNKKLCVCVGGGGWNGMKHN